jgi:hypothetical protein
MWIFTEFGILMPSLRPAHTMTEHEEAVMQIRTRRRYELDYLRKTYMSDTLGPTIFLGDADYQYRAYCTIAAWADVMLRMAYDIDYTKFKPTTDRHPGGKKLHDLYNAVWSKVLGAFPTGSSYDTLKVKPSTRRKPWWEDATEFDLCAKQVGNGFCGRVPGHKGPHNPAK